MARRWRIVCAEEDAVLTVVAANDMGDCTALGDARVSLPELFKWLSCVMMEVVEFCGWRRLMTTRPVFWFDDIIDIISVVFTLSHN